MNKSKPISNIWQKAAVLGCLWASSEIVLGSFLHNLRVPFASSFLTAIGIILLISVGYLWKDKGLFWRAGLICALMKSVSPSAVIFGPMIAIFCEALLMELSIRVFRRNMFAYILGGMLAMSWTFLHKIIIYLITYGWNMVGLYKNLVLFAQKQLDFRFESIWSPVIALWIIYLLMGVISSIMGIYIGKKALKLPLKDQVISPNKINYFKPVMAPSDNRTSLFWLVFDILAMVIVLLLMNFAQWGWWCSIGIVVIGLWAFRYKRSYRLLKKPKFWIIFVLITMLTSFLFSKFQNSQGDIYGGLMIGLQMNFRAVIIIMGFAAVGTEFSNPLIRGFFNRHSFYQLPSTLEIAFETLPFVIGNMPDFKSFFKKPVNVILKIIIQAEVWLDRVKLKQNDKRNIIIITGDIGQGKTTLLGEIIDWCRNNNIKMGGILSPAVYENDKRIGYDLVNVANGEKEILSRINGDGNMLCVGKYYFYEKGIGFGIDALALENNMQSKMMVIDEIGFLELENKGWAKSLIRIVNNYENSLIIIVRNMLVDKVIEHFSFKEPLIIDIAHNDTKNVISKIVDFSKLNLK